MVCNKSKLLTIIITVNVFTLTNTNNSASFSNCAYLRLLGVKVCKSKLLFVLTYPGIYADVSAAKVIG